jgi:trk system potassium uptake protein TrkA
VNVIIVGYGRVGSNLAAIMAPNNEVSVIDSDPAVIATVDQEHIARAVLGLGYDENALMTAGIEECDVLAVVTSSDNVNLMTTEVARQLYRVPHVITRLVSLSRLEVYKQLGLDYVCDTEIVAEEIAAKILSHHSHHLDTFGSYEVMEFTVKAERTMSVEELESIGDIRINLIEHDGEVTRVGRRTPVFDGDTVMATVHESALEGLSPYMKE